MASDRCFVAVLGGYFNLPVTTCPWEMASLSVAVHERSSLPSGLFLSQCLFHQWLEVGCRLNVKAKAVLISYTPMKRCGRSRGFWQRLCRLGHGLGLQLHAVVLFDTGPSIFKVRLTTHFATTSCFCVFFQTRSWYLKREKLETVPLYSLVTKNQILRLKYWGRYDDFSDDVNPALLNFVWYV